MKKIQENYEMNERQYINNEAIDYNPIIQKIEFFRYMKYGVNYENKDLLQALACNLTKIETGKQILIDLMKENTIYDDIELQRIYEDALKVSENKGIPNYQDISKLGFTRSYNNGIESPYKEIENYIKKIKFTQSGFSLTPKGKVEFNPTIFAKYFLRKIKLITLPNDFCVIYNKLGYYELVDDVTVLKLIMHLMNDAMSNIWQVKYEKEAFKAILLNAPRVKSLNLKRNYLNLENGMLDLAKFHLIPHSPKYYSSIRIPIKYDEEATCPRFIKFMQEITCYDKELEMAIQEILGYVLTGETRAEKGFFFFGRGGNGKSVLAKIITLLVGKENVTNIPLIQFSKKFGLETIVDKTVNIGTENEFNDKKMDTEALKSIISGDEIHISMKYKKGLDYEPIAKLIFLINSLPDTSDNTDGFYRKIMFIPFNAKFRDEEGKSVNKADKNLINKLEEELDGILMYALEGLKRLVKNDFVFTKSKAIEELKEAYEKEQNQVMLFFEEEMEVKEGYSASKKDIVAAFKKWAIDNGREDLSKISNLKFWKQFKLGLARKGIEYSEKKIQGFHHLRNMSIRPTQQPYDELDIIF